MKTKAQAALEFLMTYGWAILLVIVVVGALYATGMLKPCRWVGTQIKDFPLNEFKVEHIATNTTHLALRITYLQPKNIIVRSITAEGTAEGNSISASLVGNVPEFNYNQPVIIYLQFNPSQSSGTCIDLKVRIGYEVEGMPTAVEGRISTVA